MSLKVVTAVLRRALLLGAVWIVLTGAEPKGIVAGAVAVPAAVWLSLRLVAPDRRLSLWRLARHVPSFLGGSLVGGIDVARRAMSARMRLRPGWVEARVDLPGGGRAAMGGELSLMPGTLAAGTRDGRLLVHLLDTGAGFERAIAREEAAIAAMIPAREPGERPP